MIKTNFFYFFFLFNLFSFAWSEDDFYVYGPNRATSTLVQVKVDTKSHKLIRKKI